MYLNDEKLFLKYLVNVDKTCKLYYNKCTYL